MTLPVILASGSAIRKQILTAAGIDFSVKVLPVDEGAIKTAMLAEKSRMRDIADALAEAKSIKVSRTTPGLVIGADQIMVMNDQLFDKPETLEAARQRLKLMRGKTHNLLGAVVICEEGRPVWRHLAKTTLTVREFSDGFLENYLESEGDLVLKSVGAYRFEGRGSQLFTHVEGDFFSILGLSLLPVLDYLRVRGAITS